MTNPDPAISSQIPAPQLPANEQQAAELLQWYLHAGVDIALEDHPVDQFEQTRLQAEQRAEKLAKPALQKPASQKPGKPFNQTAAQPANQSGNAAIPDEAAIANARSVAKDANSLAQLQEVLSQFKGCNLRLSAKSLVFGEGDPNAKIMLVGEAPGRDDDLHGQPFVGPCGQLLERIFAAIGIKREDVYTTNVMPWRPPGNRTPTPPETEICRPFIERHIELVNPKILVLLGDGAAKTLLNTTLNIIRLRGNWQTCELPNATFQTLPTLHPAYLLKQPAQKKLAWQDWLMIKAKSEAESG